MLWPDLDVNKSVWMPLCFIVLSCGNAQCYARIFVGSDLSTANSYEHCRQQIQHDPWRLTSIFFIDEAVFSVLLNRYYLLLHVDRDKCLAAAGLSIAQWWHRVFKGTELSRKFIKKEALVPREQITLDALIDIWRTGVVHAKVAHGLQYHCGTCRPVNWKAMVLIDGCVIVR